MLLTNQQRIIKQQVLFSRRSAIFFLPSYAQPLQKLGFYRFGKAVTAR
jgi:hypothetical protein